jgi:hypothetical protein
MYKSNTASFLIVLLLVVICSHAKITKSLSKLRSRATCSKGFGFDGKCMTSGELLASIPYPGDVESLLNSFALPIIQPLISDVNVCFGDYKTSYLKSDSNQLSIYKCNTFPLAQDSTVGVVSALASKVSCSKSGIVSMCAVFDDCGSFTVTINGGIAQCAANFATQVGVPAIVTPFANDLDSLSIGFSAESKFKETFKVAYYSSDSVKIKTVTTKGQIYLGLNLSIPLDFVKIFGVNLGEFVTLKIGSDFMIDYGNSSNLVNLLIASIKAATTSNRQALMDSLMKQGVEMTGYVRGSMIINLENLTKGLLNKLNINLVSKATVLLTQGGSNSNSGLPAGVYIYLDSKAITNLLDLLDDVFDQFEAILDELDFDKPKIPNSNAFLGIFATSEAAGFEFNFISVVVKCIYKFSTSKGSCQFHDKFFTAIVNAGKWLIKKASKFFDESGEEIVQATQEIGKFATNVATAIANKAQSLRNTVSNTASTVVKKVSKALKKW